MSHSVSSAYALPRRAGPVAALAAALVMSSAALGVGASAQEAAKEPAKAAAPAPAAKPAPAPAAKDAKAAAPAAKDAAAPAGDGKAEEVKTAWYKMCATLPITKKDKDGKESTEQKTACTTFYESFNPANGQPLVYVAVEEGEGLERKVLTVVVPPGLALPPGMALTVFQKDQWDKFVAMSKDGKTVKPEDLGLKPIELKYLHCHQTGCAAITDLPGDLLEQMRTGVGVIVRAVDLTNKMIDFPIPLKGFPEALTGKPVDTQSFMANRNDKLKEMAAKRAELVEQYKKAQAEKKTAEGGAAAPKPAAPAAKPAEKAAEKK